MNYIVKFYANTKCETYLPEPIYLTDKGLEDFKTNLINYFKEEYPNIDIEEKDDELLIDGDFGVYWVEYSAPKFEDSFEVSYVEFSNQGYQSSCLGIE